MSLIAGKFFRHYKGKYYFVLNISTHTETKEQFVNYINLYDDIRCWSRPLAMWNEYVECKPRFIEIEPSSELIEKATKFIKNQYLLGTE